MKPPGEPSLAPLVVDDVTQMNPSAVGGVVVPHSTDDIVNAVRNSRRPISIGGARHSMGGQIAAPGSLHLDMRQFNRVLAFSRERKTITVQTGITWRAVQEYIDQFDLSVSTMQTYANFTVGGSLSVTVHGRYVGKGPMIYYKQGTSTEDRNEVGVWTRELVDAASELGGSYSLPYQLQATKTQFLRAYPRRRVFSIEASAGPNKQVPERTVDQVRTDTPGGPALSGRGAAESAALVLVLGMKARIFVEECQ